MHEVPEVRFGPDMLALFSMRFVLVCVAQVLEWIPEVGGRTCGRMFHAVNNNNYYRQRPEDQPELWEGMFGLEGEESLAIMFEDPGGFFAGEPVF
jgi:hypothetical protein